MSKLPDVVSKIMAQWGKKGGKVTSKEKTLAARKNGELGGRPRVGKPSEATLAKRKSRARLKKKEQG